MRTGIAVLMPAYNEERYISIALKSLLYQTLRPSVILIGDNEATDNTPKKAYEILRDSDVEFRVIRVKRYPELGKLNINNVYYVLTRVLKCIYGNDVDYVATIEADTALEGRYFEKIVKIFEKDEKLCITGGLLYPLGLIRDPFPLTRVSVNLWGANRVYRANCWLQLNEIVDLRMLPAWDTDHVLLALLLGYHVYPVPHARSITLRSVNPFRGRAKGWVDAMHGLPIWWALYKTVEYRDINYLRGYVESLVKVPYNNVNPYLFKIKEIYRSASYSVMLKKINSIFSVFKP